MKSYEVNYLFPLPLKGQFGDEKVCWLLKASNFLKSHCARSVSMWLFDSTSRGCFVRRFWGALTPTACHLYKRIHNDINFNDICLESEKIYYIKGYSLTFSFFCPHHRNQVIVSPNYLCALLSTSYIIALENFTLICYFPVKVIFSSKWLRSYHSI